MIDAPPPAGHTPKRPPNNLPFQLTSFVGREQEVAQVKRLLAKGRLLMLTGPGGCGKTRLALAVAGDLAEGFEDGVRLVGLASLSDPALVPQTVAGVLGVREKPGHSITAALVDSLRSKRLLVVLDNCEHLVEACATLASTLLSACPSLRVLTTSREALNVAGETVWLVPSLSLPDPENPSSLEDLARYEAVRLFIERATAVVSTFALTEENAPAVTQLCGRLDGMPLAIELAAARMRALSVEQITERLDDCFRLLTTGSRTALPRQQTLRATIDWSHDLLSEEERILFRRLSVFAGGYTLEAAEAVCVGEFLERDDILELLTCLVDKSLVLTAERSGEARYRLLEMVRQYGWEKLGESGEAPDLRRRHVGFFLTLAEQADPELKGPRQVSWLKRLDTEQDNLRATMGWLLASGEVETAARLGWALWLFWWIRGHFTEGRRWMEEALAKGIDMSASPRAKALFVAGTMADGQADYQAATSLLEESLSLFRELGDKRGAAYALSSASFAAIGQERHERGISFLEEAVNLCLEVGEKWGAAFMLCFLATVWRDRGDRARAKGLAERGLELSREIGDREGTSMALYILAGLVHASSDHEHARNLFEEGLKLSAEVGDETNVAYCLEGLASIAASEGKSARAARLWGAAEALLEKIEAAAYIYAPDRSLYRSQVAAARTGLGERDFVAAWSEGRTMAPEQAVEHALGEQLPTETTPLPAAGSVPTETKAPPELRIFALGPERVEQGERVLTSADWTYVKPRELLFYLLSNPSRTKEQIGLALWPDASSAQLRSSFHSALHYLRRALGGTEWVIFDKGHYSLNRSLGYWFDVEAFEKELAEAQRVQAEAAAQAICRLKEAIELYGGEFLEDFGDEDWAVARREELARKFLQALLTLGQLLCGEDRYTEAVDVYYQAIAQDNLLEAAHRKLMRCLVQLGERGRALRHYETLVESLREELGSSPAPETSKLYERLRRGEDILS